MIAFQSTTAGASVSLALGRLQAAEAYAGHRVGGSTDEDNRAVDDALAILIATPAASRPEIVGKADVAWRWFSDRDPSIGDVLREVVSHFVAGPPSQPGWKAWPGALGRACTPN